MLLCKEIAESIDCVVNPIEKGHPDEALDDIVNETKLESIL